MIQHTFLWSHKVHTWLQGLCVDLSIEDNLDVGTVIDNAKHVMHRHGIRIVSAVLLGNNPCSQNMSLHLTFQQSRANSAFQQLGRVNIWSTRALTLFVKVQFFQCIVMSVLLYSGETWAFVKQHISPLAVFQMNCLRCTCGISLRDHVPNVDILNRCNTLSVESQLQGKRLRWLGHVFRMPNDRLPKKLLFGQVKGLRPPGRPRSSFNDVALHDCQTRRIGRAYRDA